MARPPEHYVKAQRNYWKARQCQRQRTVTARAQEQRLNAERSRQLRQAEYLSFLLAVVLESAQPLNRPTVGELCDDFQERVEEALPKEVMPMR